MNRSQLLVGAVLALIILLGGVDDGRRGNCEQQRATTDDALQEAAAGCIDLIEEPVFAHLSSSFEQPGW